METYKGDGACADLCCLSKEGKKKMKELRELRIKYAAKILLSDCNLVKSDFDREMLKCMDSGTCQWKKRNDFRGLRLKPLSCLSRPSLK